MSSWNIVTLTPAEGQALEMDRVKTLVENLIDLENLQINDNGFEGGSKWLASDVGDFCLAFTKEYPGTTAKWSDEWDNRDADEPGHTVAVFRNGEVVPDEGKHSALVPNNLAELLKNATEALAPYEAHDPKTTAVWGNSITTGQDVEPYSLTDTAANMAASIRALVAALS